MIGAAPPCPARPSRPKVPAAVKLLVVTQDPRVTLQITSALADDADVRIMEVRTPQRALQQIDDVGGWDIVLGDADTAPTGGFYLAREMKAREQMGQVVPPIVLLIARDQDKFLAKWSKADAYVKKPVDPFDFHQVVEALIGGTEVPELPGVGSTARVPDAVTDVEGDQPASIASAGP